MLIFFSLLSFMHLSNLQPSKGGGKHKLKVKKVAALAQHHKVFRAPNPELGVLTWGVHHSLMELATVPAQPLIMDQDFSVSFAGVACVFACGCVCGLRG